MRRLLVILALLMGLAFGQSGTTSKIRSGPALPTDGTLGSAFVLTTGGESGGLYLCLKVLCAAPSEWTATGSNEGSTAQVNSDWNATEGVAQILNKPELATVAITGLYRDLHGAPQISSPPYPESDISGLVDDLAAKANASSLAPVATTGSYNDLTSKPPIPAPQVQSDWNAASGLGQILNKPALAPVATSGSYNDLSNKPSIPAGPPYTEAQITGLVADLASKASIASLSLVASTGNYNDLSDRPSIPAAQVQSDWSAFEGMGAILNKPQLSTVATTGEYGDLLNHPTPPVTKSCSGTDKLSAYDAGSGQFTCSADQAGEGAGGGGPSVWSDLISAAGPLSLNNADNATTFNQSSAVAWKWANITPAILATPQSSPALSLSGQYWNGSASAEDKWSLQNIVGTGANGTSLLSFTHTGTSGAASVGVPNGTGTAPGLAFNGQPGSGFMVADANTVAVVNSAASSGFRLYSGSTSVITMQKFSAGNSVVRIGPNENAMPLLFSAGSGTPTYAGTFYPKYGIGGTFGGALEQLRPTSGTQVGISLGNGLMRFDPTNGTGDYLHVNIDPIINPTGSAIGNFTILNINPTITNASGTRKLLASIGHDNAPKFTIDVDGNTHVVGNLTIDGTCTNCSSAADWNTLLNKPTLATVATSGSYADLSAVPSTFPPSTHNHAAADVTSGVFAAARIPDLSATYTTKAREGVATGVATLDATGKVPAAQLPLSGSVAFSALTGNPTDNTALAAALASAMHLSGTETVTGSKTFSNDVYFSSAVHFSGSIELPGSLLINTEAATTNLSPVAGHTQFGVGIDGKLYASESGGAVTEVAKVSQLPAAQVQSDWNAAAGMGVILNKPALSTVATSGAYSDLSGKPTLPSTVTGTIASGTAALGTTSIGSGSCANVVSTTATGVATTDTVSASFNSDVTAITGYLPVTTGGLSIFAYPSVNNVNFRVCNPTTASITPGAVTLNWRVVR